MSSNNPQVGDPLGELKLFSQKPATNPLSELEAFSQKPVRDPNVTRISAGHGTPYMPQAQTPSRYTGNYAEEYMAQFVGSIASGISSDYVKAPAKQGLPGETAIRTAGRVIGSVPNLLFGAGIINAGIKGAVARIPKAAKAIMTVARGIFTEEAVRGTINNSVDFYEALKSGDMDAVEYAAAGAIIDAAFAGLMAKGWVDDAKTLKTMRDKMMADRFANAKNVTPEPPKTLAEEAAKTEAVKVAEATEPQGPTPELQTNVDAKESTKETVEAIKKVKVKKAPETEEERKIRMAKVRAARKVKVLEEKPAEVAKPIEEVKPTEPVAPIEPPKPELLQTEISKVMEKAEVPTEPTKYKSIQELAADWGCTTESAKVLVDLINVSGAKKAKSVEELGQLLNSNIDKVDQSRWSGLETAGDTLKNAINNKLFLADLLENKKVPTKTTEPKVNRITKVQQARIDKAKALAAEGKDPSQISYRLNMREEEVRSILGMEPAEIVLPETKVEKPVKPSEKIDYLDELNQFKAEQQPVRPKIVQTEQTPVEPSTGLTVTPADMKALEAKFGPDWDELSDQQIADFLSAKPAKPTKAITSPTDYKPEIDKVFETIYNDWPEELAKIKRAKKFRVEEVVLKPNEPAKIPPTWNDATFRYTALKMPDGTMIKGEAGSYDTVMYTGNYAEGITYHGVPKGAAAEHKGQLVPGSTLYVVDLTGDSRHIRIYRSPSAEEAEIVPPLALPSAEPPVEELSDIEKYYNKDIEKITQAEFDKYFDMVEAGEAGVKTEPVTTVDIQTGTPEPPAMVTEDSPFRTSREVTAARTRSYNASKSVAKSVDDALKILPNRPLKDIFVTTQKLLNDVNRWLDGEEVDITSTRSFLSDIAVRADQFRDQIVSYSGNEQDFYEWKDMVSDAANWAVKVKSNITFMRSGGYSTKEIANALKTWYSKLADVAAEKLGGRASGKQIKSTIRKEVTIDEWERIGLDKLLEDDVVYNKVDVLRQIDERLPKFEDVLLEGTQSNNPYDSDFEHTRPKFSTYVEPGGSDYKELFVTVPSKEPTSQDYTELVNRLKTASDEIANQMAANRYEWGTADHERLAEQILDKYKIDPYEYDEWQLEHKLPSPKAGWRDGHSDYSDIENPIVRLRFNTRIDAEGKKVLFLEELQPPQPGEFEKMPAEFQKRWREIGMKRAFKYAIDNGFDKVAWTTGEMQSARYSLSHYVNELEFGKNSNGTYWLASPGNGTFDISEINPNELSRYVGDEIANKIKSYKLPTSDQPIAHDEVFKKAKEVIRRERELRGNMFATQDEIDNYAGSPNSIAETWPQIWREAAKQSGYTQVTYGLMPTGTLSNLDLKIENEGLKKLYNQDFPNVARKLGGKVEITNILMRDNIALRNVPTVDLSSFKDFSKIRYMYSGGPSTEEIIEALLKAGRAFKASRDRARAAKKKRASEVHSETKEELIRALIERSGNISRVLTSPEFFSKYGDVGYRVIRDMNLSRGGNPRAKNAYLQFAKEVYGGLSRRESEIVDDLMSALRMVDIGKYKTEKQFNFPEDETPAKSETYLATFAQQEGLTPEKAHELYHVNEDGSIGGRVGAGIEATKRIIDHMRDEAGGLIGNKEHDDLIGHRYRRLGTIDKPATLAEVLDKKYEQKIGDINRSTHDSGIDRLAKGKETDIFEPSWKLMFFETAARAYGRIANNEAGHTLLELARTHPENPFVHTKIRPTAELEEQPKRKSKIIDSIEIKRLEQGISDYEIRGMIRAQTKKSSSYKKATTDDLKAVDKALGEKSKGYTGKAEKLPQGQVPTYVYDKGHRTTVWMDPSFAKEWIVNSKDITPRAARLAKWATMAPVTRMFATGIEPAFAFANPFRDALQIWFASREFKDGQWKPVYNEHSPKAIEQMTEDISAIASDALLRTGWHNDYIDYGGGMDFLVLQGRPFQRGLHIDSSIDKVFNYAGYLNESSEIVTRLAIMVRSLKNQAAEKGITLEDARKNPEMMRNAVFAARDYMDFAQGGWAIKLIDQAVPYLNASLVAGRTFVRSFKKNGMNAQSWYKLGQFALLAGGLYFLTREWAPNTMKELEGDPRTQNNFIIPLGDVFGFEDNTGQTRYPFLMIPTEQTLRPLKKFVEFGVDEMLGNKPDAKGAINSLWQVSPVDISSLPPLEAAIYEYFSNYDLYRMQNIRREGEVFNRPMSGTEFNANTPPALVDLGRITGASPERIRVAMSEMISTNSTWSYMLGEAYNKVFSQMPQDTREKHLSESLARYPIIKKFIGLTSPYSQFATGIAEDNERVTWEKFNQRNGLDTLIDGMNKKSKAKVYTVYGTYEPTRDGIETYMRSFEDKQIYDRLNDRLKFAEKTAGMPHRGLWMQMQAQSVEARAKTYIREVMSSDKMMEEFQQVNRKFANTDRGLSTEAFRIEVRKQLMK